MLSRGPDARAWYQPRAMRRVIFIELNEADQHFLDRYIAQGLLPAFAKMKQQGTFVTTKIPTWNPREPKAHRTISPWIIWPTIYTGLDPDDHQIVGFGQDTSSIQGKCVWDVLDANGVSTGVFGSLMSYPPRTQGNATFYVPEALADDPACFPPDARALQEFCLFGARNYAETSPLRMLSGLRLLANTRKSGVSLGTIARLVAQLPIEKAFGQSREPERAMLLSYAAFDAWKGLYAQYRPRFATLHMNHVAYMQHRYWRAAEPERFASELSTTDRRFFTRVEDRKTYEKKLSHRIEQSFLESDRMLGEVMALADDETVVVVASALGQKPIDPVSGFYNPLVRLERANDLLKLLGVGKFEALFQMNPDLTVNFDGPESAERAETLIQGLYVIEGQPLFHIDRRGHQLFLELVMPEPVIPRKQQRIRHATKKDLDLQLASYTREHNTNDQSTGHHKDSGFCLVWSSGLKVTAPGKVAPVTALAPALLSVFGIAPSPWMHSAPPAFQVEA